MLRSTSLILPPGIQPRSVRKPTNPILLPQHPLARGLGACWPLGEGGQVAQVKDIGPGALHGTMNNFPTNPRSASHHGGMALTFDGVNDYIQTPYDPNLNCLRGVSLCAWLIRSNANDRIIFGKPFNATHVSPFWDYGLQYVGGVGFQFTVGSTVNGFPGGATNVWEHWVVTADGTNHKWYFNSKLVKTAATATLPTNTNSRGILIGIDANLTQPWAGRQEGLRIYNRALNASEVAQLFAEPYAAIADGNRIGFRVGVAAAGITITVDWVGTLEELAGVQATDRFMLENLTTVSERTSTPIEELASVSATTKGTEEQLTSAQGITRVPAAFETTVNATQRIPLEWAGTLSVQLDNLNPLAWGATSALINRVPLEELASLKATKPNNLEELATNQATVRAPLEENASVAAITRSPLEFGGSLTVTLDQLVPLEWRTGVQSTTRGWIDERVGLSVQTKFLIEQLASVSATQRTLLGLGAAVSGRATGQLAWAVTAQGTIRAWVEWSGVNVVPFVLDPEYHLKALVSTTAVKAPKSITAYKVPVSITALKALLSF